MNLKHNQQELRDALRQLPETFPLHHLPLFESGLLPFVALMANSCPPVLAVQADARDEDLSSADPERERITNECY